MGQVSVFHELIHGKSIAIVGNSPSILTGGDGEEIDSHQTTMRFNLATHEIENDKHCGSKCDIMLCSRGALASSFYRGKTNDRWPDTVIKSKYRMPGGITRKAQRISKRKPTSGLVGVVLARRFQATKINKYGITGLTDGQWEHEVAGRKKHNGEGEYAWLQKLAADGIIGLRTYDVR